MKASELIIELKKKIKQCGDRDVVFDLNPTGLVDTEFNMVGFRKDISLEIVSLENPDTGKLSKRKCLIFKPNYEA